MENIRISGLPLGYCSMTAQIRINRRVSIPYSELSFSASRSSGPGGQNVNKVNSRVTLFFDVANSPSLSDRQRQLIKRRLATRVNKHGVFRVVSQKHRTQAANRDEAIERLRSLLQEALRRTKPRKRTRLPKAAKERRLKEKKYRGRIKEKRSKVDSWGE